MSLAVAPEPSEDPGEGLAQAAEKATVGALLIGGGTFQRDVLRIVDDGDFADATCAWLIRQIREMVASGHPVDVLTLPGWLLRHGRTPLPSTRQALGRVLHDMTAACPAAAFGTFYAAQVVEASARRAVRALDDVVALAPGADLRELRERLEAEWRRVDAALARAVALFE